MPERKRPGASFFPAGLFPDQEGEKRDDSRRDFLRKLLASLCLAGLDPALFVRPAGAEEEDRAAGIQYRHAAVSVERLPQMRDYIERLKREGKISGNETFRSYIDNRDFAVPQTMPEAKSVLILAVFSPMLLVDFYFDGTRHELTIPPQYYDSGITVEDIQALVRKEIAGNPDCRLERARSILLKTLASRSGLAEYGKNNICYVDGMGSFLALYAFFTDQAFPSYGWQEPRMMDRCQDCPICTNLCPTGCIRKDNFVIDAGRCVTLYNEVPGDFPQWLGRDAHSALMGCMRCQMRCPANREPLTRSERLEDVTEEETRRILDGDFDEEFLAALKSKLRSFPACSADYFPIFTRNLSVLL